MNLPTIPTKPKINDYGALSDDDLQREHYNLGVEMEMLYEDLSAITELNQRRRVVATILKDRNLL